VRAGDTLFGGVLWVLLALVLCLGPSGWAGAQALTADAAVERAARVNVTYLSAVLAVDQAAAARVDPVNWKGIGVSATEASTESGNRTSSFGLTLPLWDQLSASATVDLARNATVSVSATPLVHSSTAAEARIAYDKAVVAAYRARMTLEVSTRKAWLAQSVAEAQLGTQTKLTALKETAYRDAKTQLDKGTVTLTEVRTALKDWADARTTQTTYEAALVKARAALAALLQTESVDLAPLSTAQIQMGVEALGTLDPVVSGRSSTVKTQVLEVEIQRAKAEAVWTLDPSLTVSGSADLPASGTRSLEASVTLSLTLGTWKGGDRALADRGVALAQASLEAAQTAARAAESQAVLAVQSAAVTVESRQVALEQARDLVKQTQLLALAGDAADLDADESQLALETAETNLFSAWADLWGARLDLAAARL